MNQLQIEELVRAAQTDHTAIGAVYDYFFPKIYAYVAWRVGTRADAEDITSTIFLKMVRTISSYQSRSGSSFQAWLYRIAQTTVIDFYRTRHTSIALDDLVEVIPTTTNLTAVLDTRLLFSQAIAALKTLPERQAEIIRLKYIAELSNQEIATLLGIHEKSVSAAAAKALANLRKKLTI